MQAKLSRRGADAAPAEARRRFTLFDLMILVAAVAAGLGLHQWLRDANEPTWQELREELVGPERMSASFWIAFSEKTYPASVSFLSALTYAGVAIRLLRPRPSLIRIGREPGWIACVSAACFVSATLLLRLSAQLALRGNNTLEVEPPMNVMALGLFLTGAAVAAGWLCQWVSRRRRPERNWVDRFGRGIGWGWIALLILYATLALVAMRMTLDPMSSFPM